MELFQNTFNTIQKKLHDKGLYDARLLVLVFIGFISVSVFWSGAKIVQQNYDLTQKVNEIEQENQVLELQNRNKELQNQYYDTNEFAEITARRVFGRAAPGEKVYIVPKEAALAALTSTPQQEELIAEEVVKKPQYQRNIEAWLGIYFGN